MSLVLYNLTFTIGLFTSAGEPVAIDTDGSIISTYSVELSSYVTLITPPVKSIVSPCSYAVVVGFVFTDIDAICFSAFVKSFRR